MVSGGSLFISGIRVGMLLSKVVFFVGREVGFFGFLGGDGWRC